MYGPTSTRTSPPLEQSSGDHEPTSTGILPSVGQPSSMYGPTSTGTSPPLEQPSSDHEHTSTGILPSVGQPSSMYGSTSTRTSPPLEQSSGDHEPTSTGILPSVGQPSSMYGPTSTGTSPPLEQPSSDHEHTSTGVSPSVGQQSSIYVPTSTEVSPLLEQLSSDHEHTSTGILPSVGQPSSMYGPTSTGTSPPLEQPSSDHEHTSTGILPSVGQPSSMYGSTSTGTSPPLEQPSSDHEHTSTGVSPSVGQQSSIYVPTSTGTSPPLEQPSSDHEHTSTGILPSVGQPSSMYGPTSTGVSPPLEQPSSRYRPTSTGTSPFVRLPSSRYGPTSSVSSQIPLSVSKPRTTRLSIPMISIKTSTILTTSPISSGIPAPDTQIPDVIVPANASIHIPANYSRIQLGFKKELSWQVIATSAIWQAQLYYYCPLGIAYALQLPRSDVVPYWLGLDYNTTTLMRFFIPNDKVENLKVMLSTESSELFLQSATPNNPPAFAKSSIQSIFAMLDTKVPLMQPATGTASPSTSLIKHNPTAAQPTQAVNSGAPRSNNNDKNHEKVVKAACGTILGTSIFVMLAIYITRRYKAKHKRLQKLDKAGNETIEIMVPSRPTGNYVAFVLVLTASSGPIYMKKLYIYALPSTTPLERSFLVSGI
ncbi:conserved hypothetical protein [Talaromyces stipitatus ATCC 10500]|uniref:Uncharacterized protein n=1 Tax=Talaromyces stipitatus (strain ATCC 10500 / CBS 375.48 / QM 6759 / NRRL 1006) TaxID=441959 RepID=B8MUS3_TALSN|nr:uncharacterized protein TSTA_109910 [Talaromyces stipitatus ATCC 10500]EED11811.1 conserved hypothetical protein [Talaromyces stipitatus ATCC 10500]